MGWRERENKKMGDGKGVRGCECVCKKCVCVSPQLFLYFFLHTRRHTSDAQGWGGRAGGVGSVTPRKVFKKKKTRAHEAGVVAKPPAS